MLHCDIKIWNPTLKSKGADLRLNLDARTVQKLDEIFMSDFTEEGESNKEDVNLVWVVW